jgi:hypothetical protein
LKGLPHDAVVTLGKEDKLITGDIILHDGFGNDPLGHAVGVDVGL